MKSQTATSMYKVSGYTALGLVAFFLLMKFFNLITIVELRFVNFFILAIGVRQMLAAKKRENAGNLEYLPGMLVGFMTALMASIFFAAFVFLYLSFIDHALMEFIRNTQPFGAYLSPGASAL